MDSEVEIILTGSTLERRPRHRNHSLVIYLQYGSNTHLIALHRRGSTLHLTGAQQERDIPPEVLAAAKKAFWDLKARKGDEVCL